MGAALCWLSDGTEAVTGVRGMPEDVTSSYIDSAVANNYGVND